MAKNSNNQFEVKVDENNIIHLRIGSLNASKFDELKYWVEEVEKIVADTYRNTGKKVSILVDISGLKEYSAAAFAILSELLRFIDPYVSKIATLGGLDYLSIEREIIINFPELRKAKNFSTKEEALAWLNQPGI